MNPDSNQTNWQVSLKVTHPTFNEPQVMREARVMRRLSAFLSINAAELDPKVLKKFEKTINVRMLALMDDVRDAAQK